jgi:hypothetical protein
MSVRSFLPSYCSTMIYSMQILYKTVQFHFSRDMCRLAVDCVYVKYIVRENPEFHGLIVLYSNQA